MSEIETSIEEIDAIVRHVHVTIPAERVGAALDKAFKEVGQKAELKGFRKGKVPRRVLEQRFGADVTQDVLGELMEAGCREAIRANELDVVSSPSLIKHDYEAGGALTFDASMELRPVFELMPYSKLKATRKIVRVSDESVEKSLIGLSERMAVLVNEEERVNVEPGDVLVFDMYGFEGDEPVEGTSGQGLQLEVGAGRFPEDFEKQLVGVIKDVKTPLTVEFPEDYGQETLAGKTVRFDVTVSEIKKKVLPELDDDFAKDLGIEDCETLDDLKGRIRSDLEARAASEADGRLRDELLGGLVEQCDFEVPASLVEQHLHDYLHEAGIGHGEADEEKAAELRKALEPRARKQVQAGFLLDSIAKAEGVQATEEEVRSFIQSRIAQAGERAEEARKHYSRPAVVGDVMIGIVRDKAASKIVELSNVVDEEIDESQVADPQ